jgi:hypothetical protein
LKRKRWEEEESERKGKLRGRNPNGKEDKQCYTMVFGV